MNFYKSFHANIVNFDSTILIYTNTYENIVLINDLASRLRPNHNRLALNSHSKFKNYPKKPIPHVRLGQNYALTIRNFKLSIIGLRVIADDQ